MGRGEWAGDDVIRLGRQLPLCKESANRAVAGIIMAGITAVGTLVDGRCHAVRVVGVVATFAGVGQSVQAERAERYRSVKDQHHCDQFLSHTSEHHASSRLGQKEKHAGSLGEKPPGNCHFLWRPTKWDSYLGSCPLPVLPIHVPSWQAELFKGLLWGSSGRLSIASIEKRRSDGRMLRIR